jgi:calcineurin-like phosphoesterase family protein
MGIKLNSVEGDVWLVSDSHYGHKNIVRGTSEWSDKFRCRDFNTVEEMNTALVSGINDNVKENDVLIHLGDWSFNGMENIIDFRRRLNVKTIYLVFGNHDTNIVKNASIYEVFFEFLGGYTELQVDKQFIVLSHYPITSWNRAYRGSWMLHGHCHGTLFTDEHPKHWYKTSKTMDMGVDCAYEMFGEYRPFKFSEVKDIMDKRSFKTVDHHDKETQG